MKMGGLPHGTGNRQGGRIPTRQRRPERWADSHTAAAPGKVGGFPHGSGARQGGRISTRQRRPARWADSHTAPAPGKVGGFPHGSGAGPVGFRRIGVLPNALTRRKKTAWRRPHKAENPLKAGYLLCSL
ncbi:TPA: hypothetical protein MHW22_28220 [Klebsiella pneumoniae]|nr:hypothetical protein [Klebsiella pneumoniae]